MSRRIIEQQDLTFTLERMHHAIEYGFAKDVLRVVSDHSGVKMTEEMSALQEAKRQNLHILRGFLVLFKELEYIEKRDEYTADLESYLNDLPIIDVYI